MSYLLNLDFSNRISKKLLIKHLVFLLIWTFGISIFIFRLDILFVSETGAQSNLVKLIGPILLFVTVVILLIRQKWYNSLAMVTYPLLVIFWFLPKIILKYGKFYALIYYLDFLYKRLRHFKRTIVLVSFFLICFLLFTFFDYDWSRLLMIILLTFLFLKFLFAYFRNSFQPVQLFGYPMDKTIEVLKLKNIKLIDTIENVKDDDKLDAGAKREKKLGRLILVNYFLGYLSQKLTNFRGRKAYILFAITQLLFYVVVGLLFFTFVNYQVYKIDHSLFSYSKTPDAFDFLYYSVKNITFSTPDYLKPDSWITRLIEIFGFLVFSLFFLIIAASHLISLRSQKMDKGLQMATQNFEFQTSAIANYVKDNYQVEISQAANEIESIKKSIQSLKKMLDDII